MLIFFDDNSNQPGYDSLIFMSSHAQPSRKHKQLFGGNRMGRLRTIFFAFILVCCTGVVSAENIHIVTEILPPWQVEENDRIGGIATEVVQATFAEAGIQADILVYPWVRAYNMALKNKNVLIYSMVRTKERAALFKWVGVIGSIKEHFYRLDQRHDIILQAMEDAKGYTIAVPREDFRHQYLKERNFNIHAVDSQKHALKMLFAGRADLVLDDEVTLFYELQHMGLEPTRVTPVLFIPEMSTDFEMAFSLKTDDTLVKRIRTALQSVKQKGIYQMIMDKHSRL